MSLVKQSGGGAALPGAVSLFNRDDVPAGYTPITGVVVPPYLYKQPRTTLITDPTHIGGVASTIEGHWLTDYASDEHVYLLNGAVLRRFNPFTGDCVQLAACPSAPTYAVSTPGGIYAYGANTAATPGRIVYRYEPSSDSWSQVVSLPAARFSAGAVYVAEEDSVYILGGSSAYTLTNTITYLGTVVVHNLAANTVTASAITLPATHSYRAAPAGPGRIHVWGGNVAAISVVLSLSTGVVTDVPSPFANKVSYTAVSRPDGSLLVLGTVTTEVFTLAPGAVNFTPAAGVAGSALRTPRFYNSNSYASQVLPLRDDLILTSVGGSHLALTNLAGLDKAPRGTLFFARKD